MFGYWLSGQTIDADSGRARALEDRRRLARGSGTDIEFNGVADFAQSVTLRNSAAAKSRPAEDAALAQGRLALQDFADAAEAAGDTARAARLRDAAARVAVLEADRSVTPSAQTALDDYNALRLARSVLESRMPGATEAERAVLKGQCERLGNMINVRSEALGTVAGLAYGGSVAGAVRLPVDAVGADAPDLMYQVGGRLLIVECKGGDAQLGTRTARVGGEEVSAPQNTPEALRSLALDMVNGTNRTANDRLRGQQILDALNATPPLIDYVVVRQPVNANGTPGRSKSRPIRSGTRAPVSMDPTPVTPGSSMATLDDTDDDTGDPSPRYSAAAVARQWAVLQRERPARRAATVTSAGLAALLATDLDLAQTALAALDTPPGVPQALDAAARARHQRGRGHLGPALRCRATDGAVAGSGPRAVGLGGRTRAAAARALGAGIGRRVDRTRCAGAGRAGRCGQPGRTARRSRTPPSGPR